MSQNNKENEAQESTDTKTSLAVGRRDVLKKLATVPVFGGFLAALLVKQSKDGHKRNEILSELGLDKKAPAVVPKTTLKKKGDLIRLGIIGYGIRGEQLLRAAGFAHPEWIEKESDKAKDKKNKSLEMFLNKDDLNVAITGVCDLFDVRADKAITASVNDVRPGGGSGGLQPAKRYLRYQDMLASNEIDAVIIATPDHWHAQMTIDAAKAGKHVYCEKCITRTPEEVNQVAAAVKKSGIIFQLGHQNHQVESHYKAKEIIDKNILGPITLIETTTNRNRPNGAWVYKIHEKGNPKTIDWDQFQGPAPRRVPFSLERFFRWRCWFDYGTGLSGDLFSHAYAAVNQILGIGIPETAVASGGIYFFNRSYKDDRGVIDTRDVPDVFHAVLEYPKRNLTLIYSATLANGNFRGTVFMGHDATMRVGSKLTVHADEESTRFKDKIEKGIIDTDLPIFSYRPGSKGIDAVTSATEKYFAEKGLLYTYRSGKRVNSTHLHMKDWLDCIRNGGTPKCHIDLGYEEGMTCHMATQSYLKGRKVKWDPVRKKIV
jgi:predicted dehydrogenase